MRYWPSGYAYSSEFLCWKGSIWTGKKCQECRVLGKNCKVAQNRLLSKYAPHMTSSLLKLKSEFHNNNFESIMKDLDKWITNLEGL